jgi:hypothetical protein
MRAQSESVKQVDCPNLGTAILNSEHLSSRVRVPG